MTLILDPRCSRLAYHRCSQPYQAFTLWPGVNYRSFSNPLKVGGWVGLATQRLSTWPMSLANDRWWDSNCILKRDKSDDTLTFRPRPLVHSIVWSVSEHMLRNHLSRMKDILIDQPIHDMVRYGTIMNNLIGNQCSLLHVVKTNKKLYKLHVLPQGRHGMPRTAVHRCRTTFSCWLLLE